MGLDMLGLWCVTTNNRHHQVPANIKLEQWIADLALRLQRLGDLSSSLADTTTTPLRVWLGGLFQPGAFLTATRQWSARTQVKQHDK